MRVLDLTRTLCDMATGRSTQLAGQVGEYLVAAQLCRHDLIAATFSGNVEHFDILASDPAGVKYAVQVKTIRTGDWQLRADRFLEIEQHGTIQKVVADLREPHPGLICVFVMLGATYGNDAFFVLPWVELQRLISKKYRAFLSRINGTRPRSPESRHTGVSLRELEPYRDAWQLFKVAPTATRGRR